MSNAKRFDRRSLFDVFRRALETERHEAAPPPSFSLAAFYERRADRGGDRVAFPRFSLRDGLTPEPGETDERT